MMIVIEFEDHGMQHSPFIIAYETVIYIVYFYGRVAIAQDEILRFNFT